jgi:hypothetical protein
VDAPCEFKGSLISGHSDCAAKSERIEPIYDNLVSTITGRYSAIVS